MRRRDGAEHPHQRQHAPDRQHAEEPPRDDPPGRQAVEDDIDRQLARRQRSKRQPEAAEHRGQRFGQRCAAQKMHTRQHAEVEQQNFLQLPETVHRKGSGVRSA